MSVVVNSGHCAQLHVTSSQACQLKETNISKLAGGRLVGYLQAWPRSWSARDLNPRPPDLIKY